MSRSLALSILSFSLSESTNKIKTDELPIQTGRSKTQKEKRKHLLSQLLLNACLLYSIYRYIFNKVNIYIRFHMTIHNTVRLLVQRFTQHCLYFSSAVIFSF